MADAGAVNLDKLAKLKKAAEAARIGGKGTVRRKKKTVHKTTATDDKKIQATLKRLGVNNIPGIEEVNIIKNDSSVIHFNNPKVQASIGANTYVISGNAESKQLSDIGGAFAGGMPDLETLKRMMASVQAGAGASGDDEEPPELVNFEQTASS